MTIMDLTANIINKTMNNAFNKIKKNKKIGVFFFAIFG